MNNSAAVIPVPAGYGAGGFSAPAAFAADSFRTARIAADFNADGRMDIAAGASKSNIDAVGIPNAVERVCHDPNLSPPEEGHVRFITPFGLEQDSLPERKVWVSDFVIQQEYTQRRLARAKFSPE